MLGFAALTPTYLEHAARMRFGCDRSDFFRDDYLSSLIFPGLKRCEHFKNLGSRKRGNAEVMWLCVVAPKAA